MTSPGGWLLALASWVLPRQTVERMIEPIVADLRCECAAADEAGDPWLRRRVLVAGYWGGLKAVCLCATSELVASAMTWPTEERTALQRAALVGGIAVAILTMIMLSAARPIAPRPGADTHRLAALLVPGYLVVTLPLGLAAGILAALRGRRASARLYGACIAAGVLCSLTGLLLFGWIGPRSFQAFRITIAGGPVAPGLAELTLPELLERERASLAAGAIDDARSVQHVRNLRLYWSCSGLILALGAIAASATVARVRAMQKPGP